MLWRPPGSSWDSRRAKGVPRRSPPDRCRSANLHPTKGDSMNLLASLKRYTTVVADTGDFEAIAEHKPQDATTNPSLLFQASQKPHYQHLVDKARDLPIRSPGAPAARSVAFIDKLFITFGCEILKIVPGRVSTE